jgi:hypothetical protein
MFIELLSPYLIIALANIELYCHFHALPFTVTRTLSERIEGISKTDSHADGRAFDMSTRGWTIDDIDNFVHDMNRSGVASLYGATSRTDGVVRLVVYEPNDDTTGRVSHLHIQVRRL